MSSNVVKRKKGKKVTRKTSNVFAMFDQNQIKEFKEAFSMIDNNSDGVIDANDLTELYNSLGKNPSDKFINDMLSEGHGPINFTMFLTMFGEKLNGTDSEEVIRSAFQCFDDDGKGMVSEERLTELLTTMGDRFTKDQVEQLLKGTKIDDDGNLDYYEFAKVLKHGTKDKDDE